MLKAQLEYEERSNCYHKGTLAWQVLEIQHRNIKQVMPVQAILDFNNSKL